MAAPDSRPISATPTATSGVPVPPLRWRSCGAGLPGVRCATATVPLDYDDPRGATTYLALAKVPASDRAHRIGTVFVNPGGPGGSGVQTVEVEGQDIAEQLDGRFDVVGFDPRGIAGSDPIHCFPSERAVGRFLDGLPVFPYRQYQERPFFDRWTTLAGRCLSREPLARHMSTADVARDLDVLRQAVGDERLNYLGFSYGSYIGNTYANLFPDRIRAMVVDGVLDPRLWADGTQVDSDRVAADRTWDELLRLCDTAGDECAFHTSGASAKRRWERTAQSIRKKPVGFDDGGSYTYDLLISDALGVAFSPEEWDEALAFFDAVADAVESRAGAAAPARRAALDPRQRPVVPKEATYQNAVEGGYGNMCADADYPDTFAAFDAIGEFSQAGGRFGPDWWWFNAPCAHWPTAPDRYTGPWSARTSAPVLVVGNYFDPSTAYSGAKATANLLPNSRLLSYAGWGHTAYQRSRCVTEAVDAYFLEGTVPAAGTVCPANPNPFLDSGVARRSSGAAAGPWVWSRPGLGGPLR